MLLRPPTRGVPTRDGNLPLRPTTRGGATTAWSGNLRCLTKQVWWRRLQSRLQSAVSTLLSRLVQSQANYSAVLVSCLALVWSCSEPTLAVPWNRSSYRCYPRHPTAAVSASDDRYHPRYSSLKDRSRLQSASSKSDFAAASACSDRRSSYPAAADSQASSAVPSHR